MREVTQHRLNDFDSGSREPIRNPVNDALVIEVLDGPGPGGAQHLYRITGFDSSTNPSDPWTKLHGAPAVHSHLLFQQGGLAEVGAVNGITHEALLAIVIDRLQAFEQGPFQCPENAQALIYLESALVCLNNRTRSRVARGVLGKHKK